MMPHEVRILDKNYKLVRTIPAEELTYVDDETFEVRKAAPKKSYRSKCEYCGALTTTQPASIIVCKNRACLDKKKNDIKSRKNRGARKIRRVE